MNVIPFHETMTGLPFRKFVQENIFGQYTMHDMDGHVISNVVSVCAGDHLEIGVLHGGSCVLAAWAKKSTGQEGDVYGIDPFPGYTAERTPVPPPPTIEAAEANVAIHGLENRVHLYKGYHPPLPPELRNHRFASAFIDGDHKFEPTLADWEGIKDKVDGVIMFHDVHNPKWGSKTVFEIAQRDSDWEFLIEIAKIGAVKRVGYEPDWDRVQELLEDK